MYIFAVYDTSSVYTIFFSTEILFHYVWFHLNATLFQTKPKLKNVLHYFFLIF